MPKRVIDRIRNAISTGNYDITLHAIEEMADDNLGLYDIESAILNGQVVKSHKDDPRGVKYTIAGVGVDSVTPVGIVGRFTETAGFLIITVYKVE